MTKYDLEEENEKELQERAERLKKQKEHTTYDFNKLLNSQENLIEY
jgi:hypothetical protein